jgi:hypothetical protein
MGTAGVSNMVMRWNHITPGTDTTIDVLVHLHGFAGYSGWDGDSLLDVVTFFSGLELNDRNRPTLALLAVGKRTGSTREYSHPDLTRDDPSFLAFINYGLRKLSSTQMSNAELTVGRIGLSSHSGGGATALRLIGMHKNAIHEIVDYDCMYQSGANIVTYLRTHVAADTTAAGADVAGYMSSSGHSVRNFYTSGSTQTNSNAISGWPRADSPIRAYYQNQHTGVEHAFVGTRIGPKFWANNAFDLSEVTTVRGGPGDMCEYLGEQGVCHDRQCPPETTTSARSVQCGLYEGPAHHCCIGGTPLNDPNTGSGPCRYQTTSGICKDERFCRGEHFTSRQGATGCRAFGSFVSCCINEPAAVETPAEAPAETPAEAPEFIQKKQDKKLLRPFII